jgi:hypothetical protein
MGGAASPRGLPRSARIALLLVTGPATACGSSGGAGSGDGGIGGGRDAAIDSESDNGLYNVPPLTEASVCGAPGGSCNMLAQLGGPVTATCSESSPPALTGGTIVDGTYVMTSATVYTSGTTTCAGLTFRAGGPSTIAMAAPCMQAIDPSGGAKNYARSTSGNMLTLMEVCPGVMTATVPYTATATTFSELSSVGSGIDVISVFQKQ